MPLLHTINTDLMQKSSPLTHSIAVAPPQAIYMASIVCYNLTYRHP